MADEQIRLDEAAPVRPVRRPVPQLVPPGQGSNPASAQRAVASLSAAFEGALDNRRLVIALPAALIGGILIYRYLPDEPQLWALLALLASALVACWCMRHRYPEYQLSLLGAGVAFGACLLPVHGALFGTEMLRGAAFGTFQMRVDAIHSDDGSDARIIVSDVERLDEGFTPPVRRARLFMPSEARPEVGETIEARVRFYAVPAPVIPNGYDSQFQSYFDGIGAFGSVIGDVTQIAPADAHAFAALFSRIRFAIGARIDAALSGVPDAIARALVIGDQGQIPDETREHMASAGLAHVLAISGLHLTLVAGGVFAGLRMGLALSQWASLNLDLKRIAAVGGMATGLFYLSISGGSVSAIRATIMLMLVFGAVLAGRRALTMRNVALAALFVILTDPASIFRPSFQLSFAAVVALVGIYETFRPSGSTDRSVFAKFLRFLGGLSLTSLIAGGATALFAAYHFQQMAPLGVLGNLLAVPVLAFVVLPSAFLGVLVIPLGIDALFFNVTGWGIERILWIAEWVSGLSVGWTSSPPLTPVVLLIGGLALCWLAFFEGRWRFAGILAAVPLVALFGPAARPDLLVADTTQAIALRMDGEMRLVAGRDGTFAVNAWQEAIQEPIEPVSTEARSQSCGGAGCYFLAEGGQAVSFVTDRSAFAEDCRAADLVLTRLTAPRSCADHATVIDRMSLLQRGVHWVRWQGGTLEVRPSIADPTRPWRIQPPERD